ncbi:DUF3572 family protein [Sandarakinorhabdus sp.]|uniref:DUF3572 family protein n=1 Tax=Sandarakinorhabdus sp. TaxID=1916663 RepID=UPI00286DB68B|nr:DUF3572 family protein [Sandarakinorhabdus sp.]
MVNEDLMVLALRVLGHVAGDGDMGPRLLALTGLDADGLRARASDPALLGAVIAFLMAREADLITTAAALEVPPSAIVRAGQSLGEDEI